MRLKHLAAIILPLLCAMLASCQVGRYIVYNFADIRDYKKFPSRPLKAASPPFKFAVSPKGRAPQSITVKGKETSFEHYLERNKTVAFLIIRNDTIQYEKYFNGYDNASVVASFSMAKSVTSMLIGCAIEDGLIRSVNDPITDYIPEMRRNGLEHVTILHLLQMTSGIRFNESYVNPFGDAAGYYYGRHLRRRMARMTLKKEPGTSFEYISGNTQVLGWVLERALKTKTITQYLQEKLWGQMGMEWDATWSIDQKKNGQEKTFCCLNARARDFARLGRLYLKDGNWNGKQLVPKKWVATSTKIDTSAGSVWYYQYQWWLPTRSGDYMAQGHLGQYIYVNPAKNIVIVRLGKKEGKTDWWQMLPYLASMY